MAKSVIFVQIELKHGFIKIYHGHHFCSMVDQNYLKAGVPDGIATHVWKDAATSRAGK